MSPQLILSTLQEPRVQQNIGEKGRAVRSILTNKLRRQTAEIGHDSAVELTAQEIKLLGELLSGPRLGSLAQQVRGYGAETFFIDGSATAPPRMTARKLTSGTSRCSMSSNVSPFCSFTRLSEGSFTSSADC